MSSAAEYFEDNDFQVWYNLVNKACQREFGVYLEDMPDQPYQEWFEDGLDVRDAIEELVEEFYDDHTEHYEFSDADCGL